MSTSQVSQQHYCLRWNNHQHNLLGVLESVLASQQYADVSLFCEGRVLRVHKLVLLASSTHFERILEASPAGQQPVIILDGTRYADLRALVDYMYRGEVNIEQDQLSSLLKTAETLKIKGLADVANNREDDNGEGSNAERTRKTTVNSHSPPLSKRSKPSPPDIRDQRIFEHRDDRPDFRDHSRDTPRDFSSHYTLPSSASGNGSSAGGMYQQSRRGISPSPPMPTSASLNQARSLLYSSTLAACPSAKSPVPSLSAPPYFPGALVRPRSPHPQFESGPGSSLLPPRTSPNSPASESSVVQQIGMNPFGLPFSLPLLHDSKKILDRCPHKLLPPSHYDQPPPESREKERFPPNWPPRISSNHDHDRDYRDREAEREREHDRISENDNNDRQAATKQNQQQVTAAQNPQPPPQQYHPPTQNNPPSREAERIKQENDPDRRNEDEKSHSSPDEKYSPSNGIFEDASLISSNTEITADGEGPLEEDESGVGGRDGVSATTEFTANNTMERSLSVSSGNGNAADLVKCPYCPRAYRHQNNLRTHIRCFHKGVRIPCPICHRGFTRWFTVRCHIAREHQNVDFSRPENLPVQLRRTLYPPYPE